MSEEPKRRQSGKVAAQAYRVKYDSVTENTLPLMDDVNERAEALLARVKGSTPVPPAPVEPSPVEPSPDSPLPILPLDDPEVASSQPPDTLPEAGADTPVCKDPRREPEDDSRRDDVLHVDIVPDPFPSSKRK